MNSLLLAIILIPTVEIYLFIKIGSYIGKIKNTFSSFQKEVSSVTEEIDKEQDILKDENLKKEKSDD